MYFKFAGGTNPTETAPEYKLPLGETAVLAVAPTSSDAEDESSELSPDVDSDSDFLDFFAFFPAFAAFLALAFFISFLSSLFSRAWRNCTKCI